MADAIFGNFNNFCSAFSKVNKTLDSNSTQIIIPCDFIAKERDVYYINDYLSKLGLQILDIKYLDNKSFFKLTHIPDALISDDIFDYFTN